MIVAYQLYFRIEVAVMKIIAVAALKGGVGKTKTAVNLAAILAENHKVLAIDIDPQCNMSNDFGIDISNTKTYSCLDIFETKSVDPENLVVRSPLEQLPNLDIIPSNILLIATEGSIYGRAGREHILMNYIDDHKSFFKQYDYIFMDTNPSMGPLNQNAFLAADGIILVTDVDDNSRIGVDLFMSLWRSIRRDLRKEDNVKALILNKADVRVGLTEKILEYCQTNEKLSKLLVSKTIRPKAVYPNAAVAKLPMCLYKDVCPKKDKRAANEAYLELQEVVESLKEKGVF